MERSDASAEKWDNLTLEQQGTFLINRNHLEGNVWVDTQRRQYRRCLDRYCDLRDRFANQTHMLHCHYLYTNEPVEIPSTSVFLDNTGLILMDSKQSQEERKWRNRLRKGSTVRQGNLIGKVVSVNGDFLTVEFSPKNRRVFHRYDKDLSQKDRFSMVTSDRQGNVRVRWVKG